MPEKQQLEGISVLVVEDSPDARVVMDEALRRYGATVSTADSARTALGMVEKSRPDVLLSDIGMPQMNGYTMLKKIRELEERKRFDPIPAAAVTAFNTPADLRKSRSAGFRFHLSKPFVIDDLIRTVAVLAGRADNRDR